MRRASTGPPNGASSRTSSCPICPAGYPSGPLLPPRGRPAGFRPHLHPDRRRPRVKRLSIYLYRVAFKFFDTGEAAALAIMVMLAMSLLYAAVSRLLPLERAMRRHHAQGLAAPRRSDPGRRGARLRVPALLASRHRSQERGRTVPGDAEPLPHEPTLGASSVLVTRGFFGLLENSVVVSGAEPSPHACPGLRNHLLSAVSRPRLRVLSLRFLPVAVVVPYFTVVVRDLQLRSAAGPRADLCAAQPAVFFIWMLKSLFAEDAARSEEAAFVDSRWAVYGVLLPLAAPGSIMIFVAWSEFLLAADPDCDPTGADLPRRRAGAGDAVRCWNAMAAAGALAMAVPLGLMLLGRRYVLAGLTFGGTVRRDCHRSAPRPCSRSPQELVGDHEPCREQ